MKDIKRKKLYYLFILVYGIILISIMKGTGNLYGSTVDWLAQHSVFPDVFRQTFYESKQLIPNFLFQTGGGQNAFLFTYYGFLSPVILFSYLLPFVDMTTYMIGASIVLYLSTGILVFVFLKRHFSETKAFAAAIVFLTLPPVNYHFHHHIMFVWYLPFLMMGLIGLDYYFEKKKRMLFIVGTFCLILTNYYFSVSSLVCLFVYAVYHLLQDEPWQFQKFFRKFWKVVYLFVLPVLLSAFVLLPTAYALFTNGRSFAVSENIENLFLPNLKDSFFDSFGMGLTGIMLVAILGNLTSKGLKKCDAFLNGFLMVIIMCPIFSYVLNGMLYVRGKVLIPFAILAVYVFCLFIEKMGKQEIRLKRTSVCVATFVILCAPVSNENKWVCMCIALSLAAAVMLRRKPMALYACAAAVLLITSFAENKNREQYVSMDFYEELYQDEVEDLMAYAEDDWYRTNVSYQEKHLGNKVYGNKFFGSSVYSSTSNGFYQNFYKNYMGNNERYRNCFITCGAKNELFYTFMGTRYIIGKTDPGLYYEKVAEREHLGLYENRAAYPIVYKNSRTMSETDFDLSEFPYTAELLMTHTVVKEGHHTEYQSVIEPCDVSENYQFIQKEPETYEIELNETYRNRLLYLTFDINNEGEYRNINDVSISINGVKNKLTKDTWQYYNGNTRFDYVIPLENTTTLKVEITEGLYDIQNLHMYTSPIFSEKYSEAEELKVDTFSGEITCRMDAQNGDYLVTSIPYDKGFTDYINGRPAVVELVNKAFVGVQLEEGDNEVVIQYRSPLFRLGTAVSLLGLMLLVIVSNYVLGKFLVFRKERYK